MDELILEIQTSNLHRYYPVNAGTTRVGRAYDNDIILSDPTIAPHHFEILRDAETIRIRNLADINPLSIHGQREISISTDQLALPFKLGRLVLALRNRQEAVHATRPLASNARLSNPFGHWLWAIVLVIGCLLIGTVEFDLQRFQVFSTVDLFKHLLSETIIGIIAFVVGLSILEKLLVNRWEIKQVIVAVCLVYIVGSMLQPISHVADYYFSSGLPSTLTMLAWFLCLIPVAIALYLVHVSHLPIRRSAFVAVLIAAPLAVPAIMQNVTLNQYFRDFSAEAYYQQRLSSMNLHRQSTLSVASFITEAAELDPGERSQ